MSDKDSLSRPSSPEGNSAIDPGSLADSQDDLVEENTNGDEQAQFDIEDVKLGDLKEALEFIKAVENASLDNGDLDSETVERLRNPIEEPLDVSDPDLRYSLDIFIATSNASERTYHKVRDATLRRHPNDRVLTHYEVKKKVAELSGVVPILSHMCPNSCMAYTGPHADRTACKLCKAPRYDGNNPAREFYTIPLGPQLQALFRSPESVDDMQYRGEITTKILDELEASEGIIEVTLNVSFPRSLAHYLMSELRRHLSRKRIFGGGPAWRYHKRRRRCHWIYGWCPTLPQQGIGLLDWHLDHW
jgi:hypothetical protein